MTSRSERPTDDDSGDGDDEKNDHRRLPARVNALVGNIGFFEAMHWLEQKYAEAFISPKRYA